MRWFLVVALVFPFLALAQVVPDPENTGAFALAVLAALQGKQWLLLGILLTIGLVAVARKVGAKYIPFLGTRRGGALLALLGGITVSVAQLLVTGAPLSFDILLNAVIFGIGSAGGWTVVRRLILGDGVLDEAPKPSLSPVVG